MIYFRKIEDGASSSKTQSASECRLHMSNGSHIVLVCTLPQSVKVDHDIANSSCRGALQMLDMSMVKRAEDYTFMRNSLAIRIRQNFVKLLSARGFIGKITTVHSKEELHLSVSAACRIAVFNCCFCCMSASVRPHWPSLACSLA